MIEIFAIMTTNVIDISPNMWIVYEKYCDCFLAWDPAFLQDLLSPMDNCISKGTEYFLTRYDLIEKTCQIFSKTLSNPNASETECGEAAKLIEVLLLNCKNSVDQIVPHSIELGLNRINIAKSRNFKILLLEIVINSIYYNPTLTISYLDTKNWIDSFFNLWFGLLPYFKRLHDMRVSILALSCLFTLQFNSLPKSIQEQLNNIMTILLQLVYSFEEAKSKMGGDEGPEEDDVVYFGEEGMLTDIDKVFDDDEDVFFNLKSITDKAKENMYKDENSEDLFELESDKEFTSILEEIDLVIFFVDSITGFSNRHPDIFKSLYNSLTEDQKVQLEKLKVEASIRQNQ